MTTPNSEPLRPQMGWMCPRCKRVYAPMCMECNCTPTYFNNTEGTVPQPIEPVKKFTGLICGESVMEELKRAENPNEPVKEEICYGPVSIPHMEKLTEELQKLTKEEVMSKSMRKRINIQKGLPMDHSPVADSGMGKEELPDGCISVNWADAVVAETISPYIKEIAKLQARLASEEATVARQEIGLNKQLVKIEELEEKLAEGEKLLQQHLETCSKERGSRTVRIMELQARLAEKEERLYPPNSVHEFNLKNFNEAVMRASKLEAQLAEKEKEIDSERELVDKMHELCDDLQIILAEKERHIEELLGKVKAMEAVIDVVKKFSDGGVNFQRWNDLMDALNTYDQLTKGEKV